MDASLNSKTELIDALHDLRPLDQEIISLRHFEEMSNADAAAALGVSPAFASQLYVRAMKRLTRRRTTETNRAFQPFASSVTNLQLQHQPHLLQPFSAQTTVTSCHALSQ